MRHAARTNSFSRPYNHRKWLLRNLVVNLVEHERIQTTLAKAKELRRWAEKAVTLGKKGTLADRRLLMSRLPNKTTVQKIFTDLAPRFKDRQGGYTRILKLNQRPGDNASMALIEFVDYKVKPTTDQQPKKSKGQKKVKQASAPDSESPSKAEKKERTKAKAGNKATAKKVAKKAE